MNRETDRMQPENISFISNRVRVTLSVDEILYVHLDGRKSVIHASGDRRYETYTSIHELGQLLDNSFIWIHRGCLVSARAIHEIDKSAVLLINGETLDYTRRRKREILTRLHDIRRKIVYALDRSSVPSTAEEYRRHYTSFDHLPVAFADIEMVFNEEQLAVDWIFRYGNEALAKLEQLPLEQLIDNSFGKLFANMDAKWLRVYERTALYGETIEMTDYSREIDTYLKVICFPTFVGHCGCLLFDLTRLRAIPSHVSYLA